MVNWSGLTIEQRREIWRAITPADWPPSDAWINARLRERGCPEDQLAIWHGRIRSTIEIEHARKKHLGIFPVTGGYCVCVCDDINNLDSRVIKVRFVDFDTEVEAKAFVTRAHTIEE